MDPAPPRIEVTSPDEPRDTPDIPPAPNVSVRVWPVFLAFVLVIGLLAIGQILVIAALAIWRFTQGVSPEELAVDPMGGVPLQLGMVLLYVPVALALAGVAVLMVSRKGRSMTEALGLRRPALPWWGYPLLLLGSWIPFAVAIGCATLGSKLGPASPSIEQFWAPSTPLLSIGFVLFIAFAPGFTEELFFRGYMQRRLLQRWSPWAAIGVTSLMFALLHIMPASVALAFPLGIWLGVMAWRTGSIWPGVFCHAIINGVWNAVQIVVRRTGETIDPTASFSALEWSAVGLGGAVLVAAFAASVVLLVRTVPGPITEPRSPDDDRAAGDLRTMDDPDPSPGSPGVAT